MTSYHIEPVKKKDKLIYQVVCPSGRIANDHDHETMESAEYQRNQLEAFGYHLKDEVEK